MFQSYLVRIGVKGPPFKAFPLRCECGSFDTSQGYAIQTYWRSHYPWDYDLQARRATRRALGTPAGPPDRASPKQNAEEFILKKKVPSGNLT